MLARFRTAALTHARAVPIGTTPAVKIRSRVHCRRRRAGARMNGPGGRRPSPAPPRPAEEVTCSTFSTGTPSGRSSAPRRWTPGASPPTTRRCRWRRTFPTAISILMRLDPLVVRGLRHGPTPDYQQEYLRVNAALDDATGTPGRGAARARPRRRARAGHDGRGQRRQAVPAQDGRHLGGDRLDRQDRPLRLAACSARRSAWPPSSPTSSCRPASRCVESGCGACRECVDACPAGCGRDVLWRPGMARELLFDAGACRHHMAHFTSLEAQICGICIAACPYALRH